MRPVQQLLAPGRLTDTERDRAERALALGPWVWPRGGSALARAEHLAGAKPAQGAEGRAVVLTVGDRQRSTWVLCTDGNLPGPDQATLAQSAHRAIDRAHRLLAERTRLAWCPLPPRAVIHLTRLDSVHDAGSAHRPLPVEGDSLGLSTILALASMLYGQPVPPDVVASAAVDAEGALGKVGRINDKVRTIVECLPGIRRVVVARDQEDDWMAAVQKHAAGALEVVSFKNAWSAVEELLDPVTCLERTPEPHQREVLHALANTLRDGRSAVLEWAPVARAVRHMRASWTLTPDQRAEADLVLLVAQRYSREETPEDVDIDSVIEWVGQRHPMARLPLLAHLVQHHATYGLDIPPRLEALIRPLLDATIHPFAYKVRGAWARWLAADGQAAEALALQRRIAEDLVEGMHEDEVSYSLAEWMRLSGALGDAASFDAALSLEASLRRQGSLAESSRMYLDCYAAMGASALQRLAYAAERRRSVNAASHLPNHNAIASRTHRAIRMARNADGAPSGLTESDAALDRLRQDGISLEEALSQLGSYKAGARRLVQRGGVKMLLELFPG